MFLPPSGTLYVWTCDPAAAPAPAWTCSTWKISCWVQRYDWCRESTTAPPNLAKEVTLIKALWGETGFGWCCSSSHPKHKPADRKSLDISLSWVNRTFLCQLQWLLSVGVFLWKKPWAGPGHIPMARRQVEEEERQRRADTSCWNSCYH